MLRKLELMGTRANNKHVPASYLFASSANRIALLQGLLDTDGSTPSRDPYTVEFSSNSETLSRNVTFLVQSLGGTAKLNQRGNGKSYRLYIKLPPVVAPYRLSRKARLYKPATKYLPRRAIVAVEYAGESEAQCIAVDSKSHLYVTDHCIVTHKTYFVKALAREIGFNAVALNMQNILGGIVGTSERNLARALSVVKSLAPVLVFMDELDQSDVSARGNTSATPSPRTCSTSFCSSWATPPTAGKSSFSGPATAPISWTRH